MAREQIYILKTGKGEQSNIVNSDIELIKDDVQISVSGNQLIVPNQENDSPIILPTGGSGATNLNNTPSPTGTTIESSSGNNTTLSLVNNTNSGEMSPSDKIKLDSIELNAKDDQTGSEIVTLIDTELGSNVWQQGGSGGGGSTSPNTFVPTNASDLANATNAGKIACIEANITLTADLTLAEGVLLKNCGGYLNLNGFTLTGQNNTVLFDNDEIVIDAFAGTIDGTWKQPKINATNFGALDDNLTTTDNFNVGKNLLAVINQSSGILFWNKKDQGVYYRRATDYDLGSPFFPNLPTRDDMWVIGDGNDNVRVKHNGGVTIQVIPNSTSDSGIYLTYNTSNSVITGGTLRGDRNDHLYNQRLQVLTPATSSGNVRLRILEFNPKLDNDVVNEINEVFSISSGGTQVNINEVINFVNTNASFSDYTASDNGNGLDIAIQGQPGVFYNLFLTDETSGGTFNDPTSPYEWGHGIVIGSNTINQEISDITITEFHGDGIARQTQGNGTSYTNFADLTQGNIDEFGVTDTDPDFYYQTVERPFDSRHNWFRLQGRSGQSIDLAFWRYWIAYYDLDGNFIEKSPELTPYQYYYLPTDDYAQYKIIVDNNGADITDFDYNIATESYAFGGVFKNILFDQNRRHCITNPPLGVVMENIKFYNTGGVLPEGGVNIEDYGKKAIGYTFINCEFQNNVGFDIIMQGPSQVNVTGCRFLSNSYNVQGQYNAVPSSVSTGFGRQVNINNSFFDNKAIGLDLYASFVNNKVNKGSMSIRSANVFVSNNTFVNTRIDGEDFSNGSGGLDVSYFKDNLLLYSEPWGNYPLLDDENTLVWEGNTLKFNDRTTQHLTITNDSIRDLKIQNTGDTYLRAQSTTANVPEHRGRIKGMRIEGLQVIDSGLHSLGYPYYASDIEDLNVSTSLIIDHGYFKSFEIKDSKIHGWLNLILDEFPDDGVGEFETVTIKNTDFLLPANIDANEGYLNNSQYGGTQVTKFIRSFLDKNVNLVFENVKFISEDTTSDRFMYLGHRGTTEFKNCTFSAPNAEVIDLTSSGTNPLSGGVYTSPNTGDVTIINPTYNNISFNLRAGDTELFYGGSATDVDAIHDNVAGEINAVTVKATPVTGDIVLIEDSEDSFNKKKIDLTNLLGGGSGVTNLSFNQTTLEVESSTGTNAAIPLAQSSPGDAGLMSSSDKAKLNSIESGATSDQTGTEIVSAIDTELGSNSWQSGGSSNVVVPSFSSAKVVSGVDPGFTNLATILDAETPTTIDPFYIIEVDGDVYLVYDQDNDLFTIDPNSRSKLTFINEQNVVVNDTLSSEDLAASTSRYKVFPLDFGNVEVGASFVVGNTYKFDYYQTESGISRALTTIDATNVFANSSNNTLIDAASGKVLPTKEWVQANSGLDTTQDLTLSDGSNLSPLFDQENSSNTRLRTYVQGSISYIESDDLISEVAKDIRFKALAIKPTTSGTTDFGSNGLKFRDFYGRNILADEFRVNGGTSDQLLTGDGSLITNNFLTAPNTNLSNIDRDFNIDDAFDTVYTSSSNRTFTVRLDATLNFPIGTRLNLLNISSTNLATIAFEPGITVINNGYELSVNNAGGFITAQKIAADEWYVISTSRFGSLNTRTSSYTLTRNDETVDVTTSGLTMTLPDLTTMVRKEFSICNSSGGSITVDTTTSQNIYTPSGQVTSITLLDGESIKIKSTGVYWRSL